MSVDMFRITEVKGNLFDDNEGRALVQCLAADFSDKRGLANVFQARYSTCDELRQRFPHYFWKGHGDCLISNNGHILNLIVQQTDESPLTLEAMREALVKMVEICDERRIFKIAMPRIGCGLGGLNWLDVNNMIMGIFDNRFDIKIYYLEEVLNGNVMDPDMEKYNFGKDRKSIDGNTKYKYY